jgi:hypothetical protein
LFEVGKEAPPWATALRMPIDACNSLAEGAAAIDTRAARNWSDAFFLIATKIAWSKLSVERFDEYKGC